MKKNFRIFNSFEDVLKRAKGVCGREGEMGISTK